MLLFYGSILKCFALAALWIIIVKITFFFSLVVVFYVLSVWHFLLVYFEFISLSVKYSLVKCFNSPFLIDDLWDCISQSDSVSPIGSLETCAIFATISQAQKSTFVSPFKFIHFSTDQALRDLSCHFFMCLCSGTSSITFLL